MERKGSCRGRRGDKRTIDGRTEEEGNRDPEGEVVTRERVVVWTRKERNRGAGGEGSAKNLGGGRPERRETEIQREEEVIKKIGRWKTREIRETEEQREKEVNR